MFTRVSEPLLKPVPPRGIRFGGTTLPRDLLRDLEVDEEIGTGELLPHSLHVRMLLLNLTGIVALLPEGCHEGRFAGGTGAYHGNQRVFLRNGFPLQIALLSIVQSGEKMFVQEMAVCRMTLGRDPVLGRRAAS